jgi:hypothetical protein
LEPLDYEVADINFGKSDMKETNLLMKLGDLQNAHTRNYIMMSMSEQEKAKSIEKNSEKLNADFIKLRD